VKFTGDYEWAGSGTYAPEYVQHRGSAKNQNQGEGVWHWNGMTDSENEDWASTSEDEAEKVEHRHERQRISYAQMNDLSFVLAAAVSLDNFQIFQCRKWEEGKWEAIFAGQQ